VRCGQLVIPWWINTAGSGLKDNSHIHFDLPESNLFIDIGLFG